MICRVPFHTRRLLGSLKSTVMNKADCGSNTIVQPEVNVSDETFIRRKQFGTRNLTDESKVFDHNTWDNVEWDTELKSIAIKKVMENSQTKVKADVALQYEADAGKNWNEFYDIHANRFFKDRHWLFTEFPELKSVADENASRNAGGPSNLPHTAVLEAGCGVGNTVFPLLEALDDAGVMVYCCDFSETAIDLVKRHSDYNPERCCAFPWDLTHGGLGAVSKGSLDFVLLLFVMSSVNPDKMRPVIDNLAAYLKPGGEILFRDYGRHDLSQLRFKDGKCLSDNFYARGDRTRVYFFSKQDVSDLFATSGLVENLNHVDQRLIVNRGTKQKMYRVWMQARFQRPVDRV